MNPHAGTTSILQLDRAFPLRSERRGKLDKIGSLRRQLRTARLLIYAFLKRVVIQAKHGRGPM